MKQLEFFFDYVSPTAWLAFALAPKVAADAGAELVWKPMFLGGVMQATGNRPPGMVAAKTVLPVLGVPVQSQALNGMDSLLSIVQMPKGIPVGTLAIGKAGAANAGLLAASMLGNQYPEVRQALAAFRQAQTDAVLEADDPRLPA